MEKVIQVCFKAANYELALMGPPFTYWNSYGIYLLRFKMTDLKENFWSMFVFPTQFTTHLKLIGCMIHTNSKDEHAAKPTYCQSRELWIFSDLFQNSFNWSATSLTDEGLITSLINHSALIIETAWAYSYITDWQHCMPNTTTQ